MAIFRDWDKQYLIQSPQHLIITNYYSQTLEFIFLHLGILKGFIHGIFITIGLSTHTLSNFKGLIHR